MSYFKVGDKVRCIGSQMANGEQIDVGYVGTITHIASDGAIVVDNMFGHMGNAVCCPEAFEKIKEEPKQMFNIKTDPWFIRVNSEQESKVVQDWLFEQGIMWKHSSTQHKYTEYTFILNVLCEGHISKRLLRTNEACEIHPTAKEIKLTFKTTIDSVQYPEMETEQQIKMKQLQATIDKAARELKELREMGEKK